jgi:hypothetical protein
VAICAEAGVKRGRREKKSRPLSRSACEKDSYAKAREGGRFGGVGRDRDRDREREGSSMATEMDGSIARENPRSARYGDGIGCGPLLW